MCQAQQLFLISWITKCVTMRQNLTAWLQKYFIQFRVMPSPFHFFLLLMVLMEVLSKSSWSSSRRNKLGWWNNMTGGLWVSGPSYRTELSYQLWAFGANLILFYSHGDIKFLLQAVQQTTSLTEGLFLGFCFS